MTKARSNATANAAKGDLTVGNGTNLSGVLGVGSNGDTIVADSSTSTGLSYQANFAAGKNKIINSDYFNWQRGTSIAISGNNQYTADRWNYDGATSGRTISRQATSDTTNLPSIQYCARVQRNNANTNTATIYFGSSLESSVSIPLSGKAVTFSFYARRGANYSAASNNLNVVLQSGTGTDQNAFVSWSGISLLVNTTASLTTTWQRFTFTATVPATSTQLAAYFYYAPVGTAGAADFFEVTGVQLEAGSTATAFQTATGTIQGELAACQRYYYRHAFGTGSSGNGETIGISSNYSSTQIDTAIQFPTTMRTSPSLGFATGVSIAVNSGSVAVTVLSIYSQSPRAARCFASGQSGITAGQVGVMHTSNATGLVEFSAEL
jgi:hypothetical protein